MTTLHSTVGLYPSEFVGSTGKLLVRFLHTSDWQLGMKALQAGGAAARVRDVRIATLLQVAALAKERAVDFVLVAGDTFEDHDVDELVVKKAVEALNQFAPLPVYIITGNHDTAIGGGVWDRASWKRVGDHVHLLTEPTEVPIGTDVALYPCPLKQKTSATDPTAWIPARSPGDSRVRVGLAHGALDVLPEGASNFPIAAARAERTGLDYLALGDWHGLLINGATAYPGTHEPTRFGESDPGHVLIVEISAAGARPRISPVRVASLKWTVHAREILDPTDVSALESDIRADGVLSHRLVRVRIKFSADVTRECVDATTVLREQLGSEALFSDWPDVEAPLPREVFPLPSGSLADADRILQDVLSNRIPDGPGRSLAAAPPEVLAEARRLLHRVGRRAS